MPDGITRDSLRKHTVAVIGASLEICSSREHVSRSETIVHLGSTDYRIQHGSLERR